MTQWDPETGLDGLIEHATQVLGADAVEAILRRPRTPLSAEQMEYVANLLRQPGDAGETDEVA